MDEKDKDEMRKEKAEQFIKAYIAGKINAYTGNTYRAVIAGMALMSPRGSRKNVSKSSLPKITTLYAYARAFEISINELLPPQEDVNKILDSEE